MTLVGVVGAGVMGTGVTQDLVRHGHDVVLVDLSESILDRARQEVDRYELMARLLGAPEVDVPPGSVRYTTEVGQLGSVEILIENITEDWKAKKGLWPVLDKTCPTETVFAANTSAIPVTRLASLTTRPDRVLGMHVGKLKGEASASLVHSTRREV